MGLFNELKCNEKDESNLNLEKYCDIEKIEFQLL